MTVPNNPGIASLWTKTAEPAPSLPRLEGDKRADVVIVGGGYSGLSAAHALQQRGMQALILEANEIGWGGSGRNGGVVTPKFRVSFPEIARSYDLATARLMHRIAHDSVVAVADTVAEFNIAAARLQLNGNLKCAHTERSMAAITAETEWLKRELGDASLSVLSREQVAQETGSAAFTGGVLIGDAGTIQPLNYARGFAAGLAARKVEIFERSPVAGIRIEPNGVVVETATGTVRAQQVIIATNAYSSLTPATRHFRNTIIPFRSAIIATEQLPPELESKLLIENRSYSETRRMMKWFRKADGRVIFGGRGAFGGENSAAAFDALHKAMVGLFPDLNGIEIAFRWSGYVGMTLDKVPHVGRLDERTCFCIGYNGAGVAMATSLGRYAAAFAAGDSPDVGLLDAARLKSVPFYPLREIGVRLVAGWYQFLDACGV